MPFGLKRKQHVWVQRLIQSEWLEQNNMDALRDATRHTLETIATIRGHVRGKHEPNQA